jgi:hypothetical protein
LARLHATHLAARAQRAGQVADATEKLQAVLNPDQRRTLNEAAHRLMARGMGGGMHGGPHGHHGMPGPAMMPGMQRPAGPEGMPGPAPRS